jgi:histidinol-phosphate aminotransferase
MLWRAFVAPGEEIIQHTPCFGIYKLRAAVIGARLVSVPMIYRDRQLLFDADGILRAITPKTKAITIAHPNNPTGNFMDDADFVRIAETGVPFVIDEAYIEYAGLGKSHVKLIRKYKNVIIARTLSKAYGLAGMRFGYALGDEDVIMQVAATLIPWNVSTIAMWAALAAFEDVAGLQERVEFTNQEVEFIETEVAKVPGITIFHSRANYVLFDSNVPGKTGRGMVEFAQKKGLILRGQEPMYGSEGWFRVTIGSHEENEMFVQTVREYFTQ